MAYSVKYLQSINFNQRTLNEKIAIKNAGRPTPDMVIRQSAICRSRTFQRKFHPSIYDQCDWLCGCDVDNALFCFPCLLFGGEKAWTVTGQNDLKNMQVKIKKHAASIAHVNRVVDFSLLGQSNISTSLDTGHALSIARHNAKVNKNRETLSKVINCIKLCGKCELPFRGHNECSNSENPGVFCSLLDFACDFDTSLKSHLKSEKAFKGTSPTIQNELLESILEVSKAQIKQEIKSSDFLAIICNDTTDVFDKTQVVIVLRYEINWKIVERFWGFFSLQNQTVRELSDILLKELQTLIGNEQNKLIAQTYDGAATLNGIRNGVRAIVKEIYPCAHFVHCYTHQLNLIFQKATSIASSVRVFFNSLLGIQEFFHESPQRIATLEKAAGCRIPHPDSNILNFWSKTGNVVKEMKSDIIQCCSDLEKSPTQQIGFVAAGIKNTLKNSNFDFWLHFFSKIMPHVEILFNQMQSRNINSAVAESAFKSFESTIQKIMNDFEPQEETGVELHAKRRKETNQVTEVKEVCDVVLTQCKERFKFTGHLIADKLVQRSNFSFFISRFPQQQLDEVVKAYPYLNKEKLKTELSVLYARSDFNNFTTIGDLINRINDGGLQEAFSELLILLKILIVTPMATSEAGRCFSTLKRIKSFLRSTTSNERLSALAMLSIEKEMIASMKCFNEKVIEHFSSTRNQKMDFIFIQ